VRWFLGDATEVHGSESNHRFGLDVEDFSLVAMGFENGAHGTADSSIGAGSGGPRLELYGTDAFCVLDGTLFGGGGTASRAARGEDPVTTDAPESPLYQRQVEAFSRAVLGEEALRVTARDGLENVRIIERARGW